MSYTATPDQEAGAVRLDINASSFPGLLRSDVNGTREVRMTAAQKAATGTFTVLDHEAAAAGLVQYYLPDGSQETVTSLDALALPPRFLVPTSPTTRVDARTVHGYRSSRESLTTFGQVIDGPETVTLGRFTLRSGTLDVLVQDYAAARDLEALLDQDAAVMLRQGTHPGLDMYFHATGTALAMEDTGPWTVSITYKETPFPDGNVDAPAWTFQTLEDSYSSFAAVTAAFSTFDRLTANQPGAPE